MLGSVCQKQTARHSDDNKQEKKDKKLKHVWESWHTSQ